MSKARPAIPEKTKVALLRETNYRCGYCMMNITPAAYFTENRNSHEAKNTIPAYYQPYDCAHIEPYNEEDPETNSFYNLIALCKNCHWKTEPQHNNTIIPKEQLKALKLHWMIASGRFTRLEIDVLMGLCSNAQWCRNPEFGVIKIEGDTCYVGLGTVIDNVPSVKTSYFNEFMFSKIMQSQFCGTLYHKGNFMEGLGGNVTHYPTKMMYIFLQPNGNYFCQKFHEAYKELDKIDI